MRLPKVFIGSSSEGAEVCGALQVGLQKHARPSAWHQTFGVGSMTLDSLLDNFAQNDFAIFVLTPDDVTELRSQTFQTARDNVLFEAGLFMGMHGKDRVFLVAPSDVPHFHVPTDLMGITLANYRHGDMPSLPPEQALGAAVTRIRQAMEGALKRQPQLDVSSYASWKEGANWPLKLNIPVENNTGMDVLLESIDFIFKTTQAPNESVLRGRRHKPAFRIGRDEDNKDIYRQSMLLGRSKQTESWLPFDPSIGIDELKSLAFQRKLGTWKYQCTWLQATAAPMVRKYEVDF